MARHDEAPVMSGEGESESTGLTHYLTLSNAWAIALGCSIGWGAFVMPATTLLPKAGPAGTVIGMVIAAAIMVVIAMNFHFLLNRNADSGGAFTFTKRVLGYDHAFLCAWSLILGYIAILWANATAFILIVRFLLGPIFQFGFHYVVAGYDVYFGEILVTLAILWFFGFITMGNKRIVNLVNTVMAFILLFGSIICFCIVFGTFGLHTPNLEPAFSPDTPPFTGIMGILALAPWAFLGFEAVSHGASEFKFPMKRVFGIMAAGVVAGALIYILMTFVSLMGMPADYDNWSEYIANLGNLSGLDGLPTFHAMQAAMGTGGLALLAIVVVCAVSTTLIGLYRTLGRLIYAVAQDNILPPWFGKLSTGGIPRNAILSIMALSVVVPFVGRAAIGWIVDVTSVSAAIVYGYASICCHIMANEEQNRAMRVTGLIGMISAAVFLVYPLVPGVWSIATLSAESYLILVAWSILGLVLFWITFRHDTENRFGKATIVWILMIFLILFASTMWMRQVSHDTMQDVVTNVSEFDVGSQAGLNDAEQYELAKSQEANLEAQTARISDVLMNSSLLQTIMILVSLVIMFNIYSLMRKREKEHDDQRLQAEAVSAAKTTFLSNVSHDIRTPMNAITGYTQLALRDGVTSEEKTVYLKKIETSSTHLLSLLNDVLEMSRIESGRLDLTPLETDITKLLVDTYNVFDMQMQEKGIEFTCTSDEVRDKYVLVDAVYFDRVLMNIVSNAYKFTPEGSITVTMRQIDDAPAGRGHYEVRVKDTGIGMTPELAAKVFEAFEREKSDTVNKIQGTGLGMAITKRIITTMGGTIDVVSELGVGTEFIINVELDVVEKDESIVSAGEDATFDFTGSHILVVDDNEVNREIAGLVLEDSGFEVSYAEDGQEALDIVSGPEGEKLDVVLMDVRMPIMDGQEATRRIRKLADPVRASIPVIAATANAFAEDTIANTEAGMDATVTKPIDIAKLLETLSEVMAKKNAQ